MTEVETIVVVITIVEVKLARAMVIMAVATVAMVATVATVATVMVVVKIVMEMAIVTMVTMVIMGRTVAVMTIEVEITAMDVLVVQDVLLLLLQCNVGVDRQEDVEEVEDK